MESLKLQITIAKWLVDNFDDAIESQEDIWAFSRDLAMRILEGESSGS